MGLSPEAVGFVLILHSVRIEFNCRTPSWFLESLEKWLVWGKKPHAFVVRRAVSKTVQRKCPTKPQCYSPPLRFYLGHPMRGLCLKRKWSPEVRVHKIMGCSYRWSPVRPWRMMSRFVFIDLERCLWHIFKGEIKLIQIKNVYTIHIWKCAHEQVKKRQTQTVNSSSCWKYGIICVFFISTFTIFCVFVI